MNKKTILSAFILTIAGNVFSQTAEQYKAQFRDADVVYTRYEKKLVINRNQGEPTAESQFNIDMLMLTDKATNMLSRYTVYHSGYNELKDLEAYTKIPSGNKYKSLKVQETKTSGSSRSSVFYDDSRETVFDFPGLTQNAIAHLNYKLIHKDGHLIPPFYYPDHLPVAEASYTVVVPDGIRIRYLIKNDSLNLFRFSEEKKGRETIYKWTINNTGRIVTYNNAPDFRHYLPHIIVHISEYESSNGKVPFLNTVNDLYNWNYSFTRELNLKNDPALVKLVDSLTNGISDPFQKAKSIYTWVQNHIRYIAFENGVEGFRPRQAADVLIKRYGDCKDMASIITNMLNIAGIKTYYTWIGTREIPYRYTEVPLPIVDNHMIAVTQINNKWYFLDATNPFATMELPPSSIQGKEALVAINSKEYKIIEVPVQDAHISFIEDSTFISVTSDGIEGNEKVYYHGYFGQNVFNDMHIRNESEKEIYVKSRMGKASNKFILGKYLINSEPSVNHHASISADFTIPGYGKMIGDNYFINLNMEKLMEDQVIDKEKRKVAVENEFKYQIRQHHILNIPEDFKVSHVPADFVMENELVSISIRYKVEGKRIIATQEVINKSLLVTPSQFDKWNEPMKAVLPHYKESIVLEKLK